MKELQEFAAAVRGLHRGRRRPIRGIDRRRSTRRTKGRILRLHASVFAFAGSPERSMLAACLAAGDGAVSSHRTPRAMGEDFVRQNRLVPYGWRVLRFTWPHVVRQPDVVVAAVIGAALAALQAA